VTSPCPDNLAEIVFRKLYPECDLVTVGSTYIVYAPPVPGSPLMYISDSLGAIARQISELESPDTELEDMIAYVAHPLPQRPK
jgi:hypothetical protein